MKRSESQSLYNALPGAYITYTSSAKDSLKHKAADKTVLKIGYWKVKPIEKDDIYYPKIVSQILPDLANFTSETNDKITVDTKLLNLYKNRSQVAFVEALRFKDESKPQIIGSIDPKLFYCPKCGQIKFLENDNDIVNMRCTNDSCVAKGKQLHQYNRIWVCSCGSSFPISSFEVDPGKYRYFANRKDGFVNVKGETEKIYKKCPVCGGKCSMENATDPKAFFPRIITSVKLTDDGEAYYCEMPEGRELIIEKQIGKISESEFKIRAEKLKREIENPVVDVGIDDSFDFMDSLLNPGNSTQKKLESSVDEEVVYKLLEYNTLKRPDKIVTTLDESINNSIRYEKIASEDEIKEMLKALKIKDIFSVANIEIINTAYGYTRKYQSPEDVKLESETLKMCAFPNTGYRSDDSEEQLLSNPALPRFYNIRTKTEGIMIDIDKREIYNYLKKYFNNKNQFVFKELSEQELNAWFLNKDKIDSKLVKKFQDIDLENGKITNLFTKCVYELLHTISHMFINTISKFCGIDKSSLSEMIFLNACSILVYSQTNQGAVLGALTQMFDKNLYELLRDVYRDNKTCTFDPLCMNTSDGNCCACSYLDEVACEHFNKDLSRRLLYGYGDKNSSEYVNNFWEEI